MTILATCSTTGASKMTAPPPENAQPTTVSVATTALGPVLVNSLGHTLYLFDKALAQPVRVAKHAPARGYFALPGSPQLGPVRTSRSWGPSRARTAARR